MKNIRTISYFFALFFATTFYAKTFTIEEMLQEVVRTDPEIRENLHNYNSIIEELKMSKSGYLPSVDVHGKYGAIRNHQDKTTDDYARGELAVKLTQNIFNGFGTQTAIRRDSQRAKAAYNKYIEIAQQKLYNAIEAYINVLKYYEILNITKENVKVHKETLLRIKRRFDQGFSTLGEVERVEGRLALAHSNLISNTNNLYDAKIKFHKSLGRWVDEKNLITPTFKLILPKTIEEAMDIALKNNPSIKASEHNIKAAKESLENTKKTFYPTFDIELSGTGYKNRSSGSDGKENELSGMLVLNYNLYNGSSDEANRQKYISLLGAQYAHKSKLKRDLMETLGLSWSAYTLLQKQQKYQVRYQNLTKKSKNSYTKEFQLGRRSLIDLLDVQDELNSARSQSVRNRYDILFAKYRVADSLGKLFEVFDYKAKRVFPKDKIPPTYLDIDSDNIEDLYDQCENSHTKTNKYGCKNMREITVDKVDFNKTIPIDKSNSVDVEEIKKLWNLK